MLLNSLEEIKYVVKVSEATDFDRLAAHINNAEAAYIIPTLGSELYHRLQEYQNGEDNFIIREPNFTIEPLEDDEHSPEDHYTAVLLWYVQYATIHLAYYIGFDMLNTYVSDGGFKRSEGDKVKSLFKYQEDNLKKYFHETGMNGLDTILQWIEEHESTFGEEFAEKMLELRGRIIPDTKTFNKHYFIGNSRLVFMRLQQHMKQVEELQLIHYLGQQNLDYILAEIKKSSPAPKVLKILPFLRDPIAQLSTAMLMEESGADLTERGLYFTGQKSISNSDLVMPANEDRIRNLVKRNRNAGEEYLQRLRRYIIANETDWLDYNNPQGGLHNRDNTNKRTFWA